MLCTRYRSVGSESMRGVDGRDRTGPLQLPLLMSMSRDESIWSGFALPVQREPVGSVLAGMCVFPAVNGYSCSWFASA